MNCPHCQRGLTELEWGGVDLDRCGYCGGLWFDPGELERHAPAHARELHDPSRGEMESLGRCKPDQKCPRCTTSSLVRGRIPAFLFWQCDDCRGIFVPNLELPIPSRPGGKGEPLPPIISHAAAGILDALHWVFIAFGD